jgi:hypothetical protein
MITLQGSKTSSRTDREPKSICAKQTSFSVSKKIVQRQPPDAVSRQKMSKARLSRCCCCTTAALLKLDTMHPMTLGFSIVASAILLALAAVNMFSGPLKILLSYTAKNVAKDNRFLAGAWVV